MSQHVILKAPEVTHFMHVFEDNYYNGHEYGQNLREWMKKIREAVRIFEQGEDESIHLWFSAPRGASSDWADYEEMKYWAEEGRDDGYIYTREDFEEEWEAEFPHEVMYCRFGFAAYHEAISFTLGKRCRFETREDVDYDYYGNVDRFFEWILDQIDLCAEKEKAGTYQSELDANIPHAMRTGTIMRRTLWEIDDEFRQWDQDELTEEEISSFAEYMKGNQIVYAEGMTSGKYFASCLIGYKANGLDCEGMTANEAYLRYSDGRDDGLSKIDENSADELIRWKQGELQEFNGHHPWEVFRGGNSTHVDFGIDSDHSDPKKSYLYLSGYHRQKEVVRMYLALRKEGIHVYVYGAEDLVERITGEGKVGIVPDGVTPCYCQSWFPGEHIESFINIHEYEDNYGKIVKHTEWKSVTFSRLKYGPDENQ